jgi:hypothetical protein
MIEPMIAGERDPAVLADMAKEVMRKRSTRLEAALEGNFGAHHVILVGQVIDRLGFRMPPSPCSTTRSARLVPCEKHPAGQGGAIAQDRSRPEHADDGGAVMGDSLLRCQRGGAVASLEPRRRDNRSVEFGARHRALELGVPVAVDRPVG